MLVEIEQAGDQVADLWQRLLTLGRDRVSEIKTADLNGLVEAELPLIRRLMSSRNSVVWSPGPQMWFRSVTTEFRHLLMNLCGNVRDYA